MRYLRTTRKTRNINWSQTLSLILLLIFINSAKAQKAVVPNSIDSLKQLIAQEETDSTKINLYNKLAENLGTIDLDSAQSYAKKAYDLSKRTSYAIGQINSLNTIAQIYYRQSELEKALSRSKEGLLLAKSVDNKKKQLNFTNKIGILYGELGDYEAAITYYQELIKNAEKISDSSWIGRSLENIGIVYYDTKDFTKSLEYFNRNLEIQKSLGDSAKVAKTYGNISIVHYELAEYKKAIDLINQALKIFLKLDEKEDIVNAYNNLAEIHFETKEYDKTEKYLNLAIKLAKETNNYRYIDSNYQVFGNLYTEKKMYSKASEFYKKGLDYATEKGDKTTALAIKEAIIKLYKKQGDYKSAYEGLEELIILKDSLVGIEKVKAIEKLQIAFDVEKKDTQINLLQKDKQIKEIEKNNLLKLQAILIVCGLLLVLFLITLYNRFKNSQKLLKTIKKKNQENELLVQEIHHRVKNNLQIVLSLLGSYMDKENIDENVAQVIMDTQNKIKSMALIHQSLYNNKSFTAISTITYFKNLIANIQHSYLGATSKNITVRTNIIDEQLQTKLAVPLGLIVNELLTNAYKYAFKSNTQSNEIDIAFTKAGKNDNFDLRIKDNGIGFPDDFDIDSDRTFGIQIVQGLVEQLGGKLTVKTEGGVAYDICIPSM